LNNITLTSDQDLMQTPVYQMVEVQLGKLASSGFIGNLGGNCVAAAEMITMMLHQSGVEAMMFECQASVRRLDPEGAASFAFVGYDNTSTSQSIDTHVVVVTRGDDPILIDISLWPMLPENKPFVVERLNSKDPTIIADYDFGSVRVTYTPKQRPRLPQLHQRTLMERLAHDEQTRNRLKMVSWFAAVSIGLGVINMLMNLIVVYYRVVLQFNTGG
jgi:hypothetical protein